MTTSKIFNARKQINLVDKGVKEQENLSVRAQIEIQWTIIQPQQNLFLKFSDLFKTKTQF